MSKPIIAAAVVVVVILTECVLAYVLIPSPTQLQAHFQEPAAAKPAPAADGHGTDHGETQAHGESDKEGAHGGKGDHKPETEMELGKFNLVIHQPASNLTLRVNFHLIGTVLEEDKETFTHLLAKNQHRLRDQVIFEVRSCELSELTDPGLALIKRKILAKSNELLGKPLIKAVVFSEFAFIEQ
jgi:flagellar FliL protein